MIEVGSLDRITVIIGERGMGKSTYALMDARRFQAETGGYVIGHSPNGQIGAASDVTFHDDLRRLSRGLKRHPERIHVVTRDKPEDVLRYGEGLALSIRKRAYNRERDRTHGALPKWRADRPAPKGLLAPPVLVIVDEGVAMRRNPTHDELAELERLLTSARHNHFALTWSSQAPTSRQWVLLEQASSIRVFRYTHEYGANALRAAGIHKEIVPDLRDLPRFTWYHFDKMDPKSARFYKLPPP